MPYSLSSALLINSEMAEADRLTIAGGTPGSVLMEQAGAAGASEAARLLPPDDQDEIARVIMQLAGSDLPAPVALSPEEQEAIGRSKRAAEQAAAAAMLAREGVPADAADG